MIGFLKAILGIDKAPKVIREKRLRCCSLCAHKGKICCGVCGCVLVLKVRVLSEDCPLGKWNGSPEEEFWRAFEKGSD